MLCVIRGVRDTLGIRLGFAEIVKPRTKAVHFSLFYRWKRKFFLKNVLSRLSLPKSSEDPVCLFGVLVTLGALSNNLRTAPN